MAADRPIALITGGSGIASATAARLAADGVALVIADKSKENIAALAKRHPDALLIATDLTEAGACDSVVAQAVARFGKIDVLVNVVGISGRRFGDGAVHECSDEGWDTVLDTNVKTTFRMCRAALKPMMAARSGSIVNVASVLAYAPSAEHFATHAYAASKGAIISLTKTMAAYYATSGIRVNAVAPGLIATPMSLRAQSDPPIREYLRTRQPLTGNFGEAEDVASAIRYLALAESKFVTGAVLEVAGGWSVAG